jgi:hypothetical protein
LKHSPQPGETSIRFTTLDGRTLIILKDTSSVLYLNTPEDFDEEQLRLPLK